MTMYEVFGTGITTRNGWMLQWHHISTSKCLLEGQGPKSAGADPGFFKGGEARIW